MTVVIKNDGRSKQEGRPNRAVNKESRTNLYIIGHYSQEFLLVDFSVLVEVELVYHRLPGK